MKEKINTIDNLKKIISAIITLAIKDLTKIKDLEEIKLSNKLYIQSAYNLIFNDKYKMEFGDVYLSLEDMLDIVFCESNTLTISSIREKVLKELNS